MGKHLLSDALCVSSIKTGTRRIMRLDELSSVVRLERGRTTEDSSSRRIMRLVPVFILETHNASDIKCLPKFVQTDNASSSIKTANGRNLSTLYFFLEVNNLLKVEHRRAWILENL